MHLTVQQLLDLVRNPLSGFGVLHVELGFSGLPEIFQHVNDIHSILKFFQVDITGIFRMTSSARYFKAGVGSSRPSWRWTMCFLEHPKVNTSCRALVKCCRWLCGSSDDTKSSMTSTKHSTWTFALKLPTVYAGRLFLSWASWAG